jgi:hypothetical protein
MKVESQLRIAKAIWQTMEREGLCDGFGGAEYQRCKHIVFDFVIAIDQQCNAATGAAAKKIPH